MKVGIDGRALRGGRGIARYTSRLLHELATAFPQDEWRVLLAGPEPVDLPHPALTVRRDPRPQRLVFASAALTGRPQLDQLLGGGLDVLWCPSPAPLALSGRTPFVLTVHDLSWEVRPGDFTAYERIWHRLARPQRLAGRAEILVCNSAATRAVLRERWPGIDPSRVRVVSPGVDRPERAAPALPDLPGEYFLAVGALEPRKGIDVLIDAYRHARARGLMADLVLAGTGRLGRTVAGPGIHVLGAVSDAELSSCYAHAIAVVMPSRLEGFGLPPLEALAHGTPPIVSDLPVFAETLGPDGALRVPPGDAEALAQALTVLEQDASLRRTLVDAGTRAIEPYTWQAAASGLHRALQDAASAQRR